MTPLGKALLVAVILVVAFTIGFMVRTPAESCALDPNCSQVP